MYLFKIIDSLCPNVLSNQIMCESHSWVLRLKNKNLFLTHYALGLINLSLNDKIRWHVRKTFEGWCDLTI